MRLRERADIIIAKLSRFRHHISEAKRLSNLRDWKCKSVNGFDSGRKPLYLACICGKVFWTRYTGRSGSPLEKMRFSLPNFTPFAKVEER